MDSCSCSCPLTTDVPDEWTVPMGRVLVCMIYLLTFRCCWVAIANRAAIRAECLKLRHILDDKWLARGSSSADLFARKVEDMVADAREKRCRVFLFAASSWWLLRLFLPAVQLHRWGVWSEPDELSLRDVASEPAFIRVVVLLSGALIVAPSPLSRRKAADALHCLDHLCAGVSLFFLRDVLEFLTDTALMGRAHLLYAVFVGNTPLVCILNVLQLIIFTLRVNQLDVIETGQHVTIRVGSVVACVCLSLTLEAYTRAQAKAQLTERCSSQSKTTVHHLLNLICDAVVFLDGALNVTTPSPKLDGLLLRRTDPGELCGTPFAKYVNNPDVDRVLKFVQEEHGHGHSLHVDMRDQCGARLPVQLFHLAFEDTFEQTQHIVGVREEMDFTHQRELPHVDTPTPLLSSRLKAEGSASSCSSGEPVSIKTCDGDPVAVWVDVINGDLPIVGCTAHFTSLGGPVEQGESFLAWVKGDKSAFLLWVQTMVNDENTTGSIKVKLLPSQTNNIEIRARCKMCVEEGDDEDDGSSEPERIGRIELTDIRLVQLKALRPTSVGLPPTGCATSTAKNMRL